MTFVMTFGFNELSAFHNIAAITFRFSSIVSIMEMFLCSSCLTIKFSSIIHQYVKQFTAVK